MKRIYFAIVFVEMLISCSEKRIEITSEYIINKNWDQRREKNSANSIQIRKMKVRNDSTINPFLNLNQNEILAKLEIDSSFIYSAAIENELLDNYKDRIYFTKDNGFYWWTDKGNSKTKILGKLEKGTWYEITGLTYYYHVIYVDSNDKVHRFAVNTASNY